MINYIIIKITAFIPSSLKITPIKSHVTSEEIPEIKKKHVNVTFINEKTKGIIQKVELKNNMEQAIILRTRRLDKLDLGVFVDTAWKPALYDPKSDDQRVLGIGINELKFI